MAKEFPEWIDPWKAAEGRRVFSGSIPLAGLTRLRPLLADAEGEVTFSARFYLDAQKRATVDVKVVAELSLTCQVSLEDYAHRVERNSRLTIIEDERDQLALPEDEEATCASEGRLSLAGLVEDECILALPQVPRKPGQLLDRPGDAGPSQDKQDTYKPFADLGHMLKAKGSGQEPDNR